VGREFANLEIVFVDPESLRQEPDFVHAGAPLMALLNVTSSTYANPQAGRRILPSDPVRVVATKCGRETPRDSVRLKARELR
jgi:hypothetical protein